MLAVAVSYATKPACFYPKGLYPRFGGALFALASYLLLSIAVK